MKIEQLFENLVEMPMTGYGVVGDDNTKHKLRKVIGYHNHNSIFTKTDRHLIKIGRADTEKFFQKTPFNFRIFFANIKGQEMHSFGEDLRNFITPKNFEDLIEDMYRNIHTIPNPDYRELSPNIKEEFIELYKKVVSDNSESITVVLFGNKADDYAPMTPWIIAHRISHILTGNNYDKHNYKMAVMEITRYIREHWQLDYILPDLALFRMLGTFASARRSENNNNTHLNRTGEFIHECFAQYIRFGKVRLNKYPEEKIKNFKHSRSNDEISEQVKETLAGMISELGDIMKTMFDDALAEVVGKIGVLA
jgi:hypothetical protein